MSVCIGYIIAISLNECILTLGNFAKKNFCLDLNLNFKQILREMKLFAVLIGLILIINNIQ